MAPCPTICTGAAMAAASHSSCSASSLASKICAAADLTQLTSSASTEAPFHCKWVRPLGYAERFMTKAHDFGCMTTVYALWLDSRAPLEFSIIKKAVSVMHKKMPHLRLALGHHKGGLWWREMPLDVVDIDYIATDDVAGTFESLLKRRYRMEEGPLWFVRFVKMSEDQEQVRDKNFNLKYKYVCMFGFHHNVSDGTTNMKFCKIFLSVLNNMVQGKEIDLKVEGVFAEPLHDNIANAESSQWYLTKLFIRRVYRYLIRLNAFTSKFIKHYPMPCSTPAGTRISTDTHILSHELDEVTTERLLKRCKMEAVTMNSAFTAAANLALCSLIRKKDPTYRFDSMNSVHALNMRRYWPKELRKDKFGCHISILDLEIPTDAEDISNFWEYTRKVHSIINHELDGTHKALKVMPYSEKLKLVVLTNAIFSWLGLPTTNDSHYCVTNMGDLSSSFPGLGQEIEVSKILRSVTCHFMPVLCQHTLQTFRGRFCYSLDYYAQKLTPEVASLYADELMLTLRSVIHQPN